MDFERDPEPAPLPSLWSAVPRSAATALAWASLGVIPVMALGGFHEVALVFGLFVLSLALPVSLVFAVARVTRPWVRLVFELTWLVGVPVWGFALDLTSPVCDHGCEDNYQPLAFPGILAVYVAYTLGLAAWVVHRRSEPGRRLVDAAVLAGLGAGMVACLSLALQFGPAAITAIVVPPLALPLAAPWVAGALLAHAAWRRASAHTAAALAAVVTTAGWLGVDLVLHAVLTGRPGLWGGAYTETCGWTMSRLVPPVEDCHYLCTVAAQGHPWLVRPTRMGRRRGQVILVNRQLAVANAFEDLLHERWPRFGRLARRTYDALAFPVSRWLLHPLAADAVFLAMLPAQGAFELVLWTLDRDKERRIDRMYR